jgi:hypothetical protein
MVVVSERLKFIGLMVQSGVIGLDDHPLKNSWIAGELDIPIKDLEWDSLASLEFALAIEEYFGKSLTPKILLSLDSLDELYCAIIKG